MSCPELDRVLLLDETPSEEVRAHARDCALCTAALRTLGGLEDLLAGEDEPLPAHLEAAARALPDRIRPARPALPLAAATAAALAAVVLLALAVRPSSTPDERETTVAVRPVPAPAAPAPEPDLRTRVLAALAAPAAEADAFFEGRAGATLVLLGRIANGDDAGAALAAIDRLGRAGRTEALPALRDALRIPDRRCAAILALAALGDRRAVRDVAPFLSDADAGPVAAEALATLGGEDAARALAAEIRRRPADGSALALVGPLARAGGRSAAETLVDLLDRPILAAAARRALRRDRDRLVLPLLATAAGTDRAAARRALEVLADLAPESAVPALRAILADRDLRAAAARALVRIDTPAAGAALLSRPLTEDVRAAFAGAGPGLVAWLVARAERGDVPDRAAAIELLGVAGSPAAVEALLVAARDGALGPAAVRALGRIGGPAAVAALAALEGEGRLRRAVVAALGETGHPAAVPVLVDAARRDGSLRDVAARALTGIADPAAVRAILELAPRRAARRFLEEMNPGLVARVLPSPDVAEVPVDGRPRVTIQ